MQIFPLSFRRRTPPGGEYEKGAAGKKARAFRIRGDESKGPASSRGFIMSLINGLINVLTPTWINRPDGKLKMFRIQKKFV